MRTAETVLAIIRERGQRGLPLERIHRLLYNRELFLRAYAKLYPNHGAMTQGSTTETVDGMSLSKIDRLIASLRDGTFRWTPVRRTYIAKKNTTTKRPLGIPTWSDKLVQEVMRSILEAYYEPQFSNHSHGFRPERGCHTALLSIQQWTGTKWFIEGDIARYFDTINHDRLIEILGEHIQDEQFLQLTRELLRAGYLEDWKYHPTLSGTPQGGVISPILSNIYLDRFDQYVERVLRPAHTRGKTRRKNPEYARISQDILRKRRKGQRDEAERLNQQRRTISAYDQHDPAFRRLTYVRYADDFLLGFIGPRHEAEEIKRQIGQWLGAELKLQLSDQKTLITSATRDAARFLGYEIVNQQANDQITSNMRAVNGVIGLKVPQDVVAKKCAQYERNGKSTHRPEMLEEHAFSIIVKYQQVYRGIVQYYIMAQDVSKLNKLQWVMSRSLLKTLANKHRTTTTKLLAELKTTVETSDGHTLTCLEMKLEREGKPPLVARFGGIPLQRQRVAVLKDSPTVDKNGRTEIIKRLLANECELCGSTKSIEVHHLRKLADLKDKSGRPTPKWKRRMAAMRRKTLVVCRDCHQDIHAGAYDSNIGIRC